MRFLHERVPEFCGINLSLPTSYLPGTITFCVWDATSSRITTCDPSSISLHHNFFREKRCVVNRPC